MNLVICHTPFQMYLFEKILKKYPNEEYHLINYFFTDTPKRKYYFKRLSKFCMVSEEVFCKNGFQLFLKTFYLSRRYKNHSYKKVFLSSIDSILCQTILSSIEFDELITFDDGLANITPTSVLYMENQSSLVAFANKILRNKYSIQTIKNKASKHFTIFDSPNISPNLEKIEIIDDVCREISNVTPEKNSQVSILLGQPIYSTNSENIHFYKKVINLISIDYYFPHPREDYHLDNISYIDTELIFEEYIISLLKKYKTIKIYTIFSTAVFSFLNFENILIKMIPVKGFEENQQLLIDFGITKEEIE
ncbi:hypothetical protein HO447_01045 [Streptococcus suis]|nr:hypothetical protein [Streptococcus suis]